MMKQFASRSDLNLTKANVTSGRRVFTPAALPSLLFQSPHAMIQPKSACACGGGCPRCEKESDALKVQTKLAISTPGDEFEQEADRVAEQVMRMPDTAREPVGLSRLLAPSQLNRACSACEEEKDTHQHTGGEGEERHLQSKGVQRGAQMTHSAEAAVRNLGGGQPLSEATRAYFEPRFGHDFSDVRVHTGARAVESARAINALAYTAGRDVVFNQGQYSAATSAGARLLAHELTHVVQQSERHVPRRIQRTITVQDPTVTTPPHTSSNGAVVVGLFDELCPDKRWQLVNGEVVPVTADFCAMAAGQSATRVSCECACRFKSATGPHVSIEIDPTSDDTQFASSGAPNSFRMRLRGLAATGIRGVSGATVAPGASSLRTLADPPWLILGHELCGHAQTTLPNIATPGRPSSVSHESTAGRNQSAVDIENQIRREHSARLGTDLGTRAGDFEDVEGNIHFGAIVQLPSAMTLITLMAALGVPTGSHAPRCPVPDWYELCGSTAMLRSIPILNRVAYRTGGNFNVAQRCLTHAFAAGDFFAIEGVFWHLADGAETKAAIAARWGVTVAALDRANTLLVPAVAVLATTVVVPAGTSVIIPYRLAPGTKRFFFIPATGPC